MVAECQLVSAEPMTTGAVIITLDVDDSTNCGDDATVTGSVMRSLDPESMVSGLLNSIVAYG